MLVWSYQSEEGKLMRTVIFSVALLLASPALSEQVFAAYEGPASIQLGAGGTKITANGIDYWTTGTPPRRYQVLGVLTDARKDRRSDGHVVGSKSVARRTIDAGGNAVIFDEATSKLSGVGGYVGSGFFAGRTINRTTTQLMVVKYVE